MFQDIKTLGSQQTTLLPDRIGEDLKCDDKNRKHLKAQTLSMCKVDIHCGCCPFILPK